MHPTLSFSIELFAWLLLLLLPIFMWLWLSPPKLPMPGILQRAEWFEEPKPSPARSFVASYTPMSIERSYWLVKIRQHEARKQLGRTTIGHKQVTHVPTFRTIMVR